MLSVPTVAMADDSQLSRPAVNFVPDVKDVEALIAINDIHDLADAGAKLLVIGAIAELIGLLPSARKAGEQIEKETMEKMMEYTMKVDSKDWDKFQDSLVATTSLKKIALLKCSMICNARYQAHLGESDEIDAMKFWKAMKERYDALAAKLQ